MDGPKRISKADTRIARTAYGRTALAMGLAFVALGSAMVLGGVGVLPPPGRSSTPLWLLTSFGIAFAAAGLLLTVYAVAGLGARRRREAIEARHPERPWLYDYPWDPAGIDDAASGGTMAWFTGLVGFATMAGLLAPFNWLAFGGGPMRYLPVRIGVGLFDVVLVVVVLTAIYRALRRAKFGRHRLAFPHFPFAPGERVEVGLSPNDGLPLEVTLRFVEERFEIHGSGRNRSRTLCTYEHWSERRSVVPRPRASEIPIEIEIPDREGWVTQLTADPAIRYWELLVEAAAPGIDLRTTFPLPVYRCDPAEVVHARRAPPIAARWRVIPLELALPLMLVVVFAAGWLAAPDLYRAAGGHVVGWWRGAAVARAVEPIDGVNSAGMAFVRGADGALYGLTKYEVVRARGRQVDTLLAARAAPAGIGKMQALSAIAPDRGGDLWVGSWYGEVYHYAGGRWQRVLARDAPLGRRIHALIVRPSGVYIAGVDGLWRLDAGARVVRVEGVPKGASRALAESTDGALIAAIGGELWRVAPGEPERLGRVPDTIRGLAQAPDGTWLAGTGKGLYTLAGDGGLRGPEMPGRRVTAVGVTAGHPWAGTIRGGLLWREDGVWRVADEASGLPGDHVLGAALDHDGRLWLAIYGGGLCSVPLAKLREAMRPEP